MSSTAKGKGAVRREVWPLDNCQPYQRPDSPLFKYATRAVPPIHILVKDGRVTLKGAVATKTDSELAYVAARGVPGAFEVTNQLIVEGEKAR